jgi:hypothetical protein
MAIISFAIKLEDIKEDKLNELCEAFGITRKYLESSSLYHDELVRVDYQVSDKETKCKQLPTCCTVYNHSVEKI